MRKVLIGLLLAGAAATPAMAGPHNNQQAREERQQAQQERVEARQDARSERAASPSDNRPSFDAPRSQPRQQMVERPQFDRSQRSAPQVNMDAMRAQRAADAAQRNAYAQQQRAARVEQSRDRVEQRQQDVREAREVRQQGIRDRRNPPMVTNTPRPGTQPPLRAGGDRFGQLHWNRNWQHDGHHDWRRYRDHHRSLFHLGFYIDPFGWNYQSYGIGYRMWPAYYGNQYWLDPAMYNLPFPPPGCAWVRYWNDAVLVDLYTGTIVDQIPGFFW